MQCNGKKIKCRLLNFACKMRFMSKIIRCASYCFLFQTLTSPHAFQTPRFDNDSQAWRSPSERYLFEGDILLSVNQATNIFDWNTQKKPPPTNHKRAALIALNHMLWEVMPIHYVFHESLCKYFTTFGHICITESIANDRAYA